MTILPNTLPLIGLDGIILKAGGHAAREQAVCAMEAVAWLAGEPHSDHPSCACPVIGALMRSWNDAITTDEKRTALLKPLLPLLLNSKSTPEVELRRSYLAFDWLARVQAPAWLDLSPTLKPHADTLRALAPLADKASVQAADKPLAAAGDAAGAAAGDAAGDAARAAAWDAAGAAAWDAARAAAWAAAWAAAGDAAWAAAGDAARDAAGAALAPTVAQLEISAADLVRRMVALGAEGQA